MISHTTERFRDCFERLPESVREDARKAFKLFAQDPFDPRLHFKCVHPNHPIYSARVNKDGYRAVGLRDGEDIDWYWIGDHNEYMRVIRQWPV